MTHEQFIEPETARLAKQAGFDWKCNHYYFTQNCKTEVKSDFRHPAQNYNEPMATLDSKSFEFEVCSRSTQSVLQRWLRDVKNIVLLVDFNNDEDCDENERYGVTIYIGNERIVELATYPTYEEALEAGLQNCLRLLIDNL